MRLLYGGWGAGLLDGGTNHMIASDELPFVNVISDNKVAKLCSADRGPRVGQPCNTALSFVALHSDNQHIPWLGLYKNQRVCLLTNSTVESGVEESSSQPESPELLDLFKNPIVHHCIQKGLPLGRIPSQFKPVTPSTTTTSLR